MAVRRVFEPTPFAPLSGFSLATRTPRPGSFGSDTTTSFASAPTRGPSLSPLYPVGSLYARDEDVPGFGFGFNVEVKLEAGAKWWDVPQMASVGSFGWGGALGTRFWVDPQEELIGIFMTQLRPFGIDLHQRFANIVYGALDPALAEP